MRHMAPSSTSSLNSDSDGASSRQSSSSSIDTAPSSIPQSSSSSLKASAPEPSTRKSDRSSLKSSLKTSRSAPSLAVRFSLPEREMPEVPALPRKPVPMPKNVPCPPPIPITESGPPPKAATPPPPKPTPPPSTPQLRNKLSKRFSAPAPSSRKEGNRSSTPFVPRNASAPNSTPHSRVTSFQSTASAPASCPSPSSPQKDAQYNPLQHYIPCMQARCTAHYTPALLGPTFYSAQQPYKFTRKRGLCPAHANQNLKADNERAKYMFGSMRQHAGRKTLGLIAAEFETWLQEAREERAEKSQELEAQQRRRVLCGAAVVAKSKGAAKGKEQEDVEWDWKYVPRPCTKKGCSKEWYSIFDNRLYLFYHTPRPSGFSPLATLCPSCARADIEGLEHRIVDSGQRMDGQELGIWFEQLANDRRMEEEFWAQAQERIVREKRLNLSVPKESKKRMSLMEGKKNKDGSGVSCVVM